MHRARAVDMKQDLCLTRSHNLGSKRRGTDRKTRSAQLRSALREASTTLTEYRVGTQDTQLRFHRGSGPWSSLSDGFAAIGGTEEGFFLSTHVRQNVG